MQGVLVLDIDGTIDTANQTALNELLKFANANKIDIYINTARPQIYCADPDWLSLQFTTQNKHYCIVHPHPPISKVINMQTIKSITNADPKKIVLIDDRPENILAVRNAGFSAIQVDDKYGVQHNTVREFKHIVSNSNMCITLLVQLFVFIIVCLVYLRLSQRRSREA
jgi:hypothetical protein